MPGAIFIGVKKMVRINGEMQNAANLTIAEYLEQAGYDSNRVVVERNLDIVAKGEYATVRLADGDNLEILCFVGGG